MRKVLRRPLVIGGAWLALLLAAWLLLPAATEAATHGGIEIGAKGVRAVVVELSSDKAAAPQVVMTATQNTTLVAGLAAKGQFAPDALKATAAAVAGYADKMRKEHQIPDARISVVGSSGLFSALGDKKDAIQENKAALVAAVREATGLTMDFVDVTREAALSVLSVVPQAEAASAVLIDVGSGNTKGGALAADGSVITFGIPYGTVTFFDLVKAKAGDDFAAAAAALREKTLTPALRDQVGAKKELAGRSRIYLGGGASWALATLLRPADRGPLVALRADDIETFHQRLVKSPAAVPVPDFARIDDPEARKQAEKDVEQVKKVFTRDQLLAGTEILRAVAPAFDLGADGRRIYFARNGYLGWILGYVTEKGRRGQ